MSRNNLVQRFLSSFCTVAFALMSCAAVAQVETVIYNFQGTDGSSPAAQLIADGAGNLYGTTSTGGQGQGTVFELSPQSGGQWTENVLHIFSGPDGSTPMAGLIMDGKGNLFGTAQAGGNYGAGVVFELQPVSGGWSFSVIHNFHFDGVTNFDGYAPSAALTLDTRGNLYGTTLQGGTGQCNAVFAAGRGIAPPKGTTFYSCGTVYELSPQADGSWGEKVIHSFQGTDGGWASSKLILDRKANLYGTATMGALDGVACPGVAVSGCGVVFELARGGNGTWTENVLYSFTNGTDGAEPAGGLLADAAGNLYGTTQGALQQGGSVFELSPGANGWTETTLITLQNESAGYGAVSNLVMDSAGNIFGTTEFGASPATSSQRPNTLLPPKPAGPGTVFELSPGTNGWTARWLHTFGSGSDGALPAAGLLRRGNTFYGTTNIGGTAGLGTVYKIVP